MSSGAIQNGGKIKVLIAKELPKVRHTLANKLLADQALEIAGEIGDGMEAVTMVAERAQRGFNRRRFTNYGWHRDHTVA